MEEHGDVIGPQTSLPEDTFIDQLLAGLKSKLDRYGSNELPSFGRPVSIVINLDPSKGIRIGLDGSIIDKLDWTMTIGSAPISAENKKVSLELNK